MLQDDSTPGGLVEFHTAHKLTLMAHSPTHYRQMGRIAAQAGTLPSDELTLQYATLLMEGLRAIATTGRHFNVLQHLIPRHTAHRERGESVYKLDASFPGCKRRFPARLSCLAGSQLALVVSEQAGTC